MNQTHLITTAEAIDPVFMFIFGACLLLLVAITIVMLYFVVRYHHSRAPLPTSQVEGNLWLETVWIMLPTLLVIAMFWYGWRGYQVLRSVPPGALEVTATARMWSWSFSYPNGRTSSKLYIPVGRPVKVQLVSTDVIHGFFLPAFRVKRDVVPGMANFAWFVADRPGSYDLFCSQYCGTNHSAMISTVEALPLKDFDTWLAQDMGAGKKASRVDGRKLAEERGCLGCHTLDGSAGVGPTFRGLYNSQVKILRAGQTVTVNADEEYLEESIRQPAAAVVDGFPPIMPANPDLTEQQIKALVELIESLK